MTTVSYYNDCGDERCPNYDKPFSTHCVRTHGRLKLDRIGIYTAAETIRKHFRNDAERLLRQSNDERLRKLAKPAG